MKNMISVFVIGFIALVYIWRFTRNAKPVRNNGLSIFYPLFAYLFFIIMIGSQSFIKPNGALSFPQVTFLEILGSVILGAAFSLPLLITTQYEFRQGQIYSKKSKAFVYVIILVILLRLALKSLLFAGLAPIDQLFLTLLMATFYLTTWRVGSFIKYRRFTSTLQG